MMYYVHHHYISKLLKPTNYMPDAEYSWLEICLVTDEYMHFTMSGDNSDHQ